MYKSTFALIVALGLTAGHRCATETSGAGVRVRQVGIADNSRARRTVARRQVDRLRHQSVQSRQRTPHRQRCRRRSQDHPVRCAAGVLVGLQICGVCDRVSETQEEKLREQKKPIHRKIGILTLASGEIATLDGIETFAFNERGTHLAMKRYAPERTPPPPPDAANANEDPVGATLIVRELATGRDMTFGNVTEYTWQDEGRTARARDRRA